MQRVEIYVNGEPRLLGGDVTIATLLAELRLSPQHVAVEVNLHIVPRARHSDRQLVDGDRVEVVSLVGGG